MSERRRDRFPENWLKYAFIFFIFGLVMVLVGQYFIEDTLQQTLYQITGITSALFSIPFGFIALFLGAMIWYDRYTIAKKVRESFDSVPTDISPIQPNRPAYLLANSFDREVLVTISQVGGDIPNTGYTLKEEALLKTRDELISSLVKLITLGLLSPPSKFPYYRVFLTTRGLDSLNAPAALFVSNVPNEIWQYVFQMKLKLWKSEWSGAAISMANSIQSMLIHRIEEVKSSDIERWNKFVESRDEKWKDIVKKPLIKWQLGDLHFALRKLGEVKQTTFQDYLIGDLISMRNKVHPPEEGIRVHPFLPKDAALMDMYMDILLQMWYGPR